jgi:uncharacterized protein YcbX
LWRPGGSLRTIHSLVRYPVKGLSPEPLDSVELHAGQGFTLDRTWAVTNGGWPFDAAAFKPRPKTDFLMLMQHERLALLRSRVDEAARSIRIESPGGESLAAELDDAAGLQALADFVAAWAGGPLPGRPRFVHAPPQRFTDASVASAALMNSVSLINLATVRDLERVLGQPVDPLRFRANIYFDGGEAWEELGWLDREIRIGPVAARVVRRTRRCAATNVNPATGARDLAIPQALVQNFGHGDMGVYAEVLADGKVSRHDALGTPAG